MTHGRGPILTFSTPGKIGLAVLILSFLLIPRLTSWEFDHAVRPGHNNSYLGPMIILLPVTLLTMYLGVKFGKMQSGDAMTLGFGISMATALVLANVFHVTFPWFVY